VGRFTGRDACRHAEAHWNVPENGGGLDGGLGGGLGTLQNSEIRNSLNIAAVALSKSEYPRGHRHLSES
jgi:hypothetical protein